MPHLRFIQAVVCAVALIAQTTVLPLAHARHTASTDGHARLAAASHAGDGVHRADTASPAHNPASCQLCATAAHARAGIVPVQVDAPAPRDVAAPLPDARAYAADPLTLGATAPRAPPILSA